jgi:hypothetical protein
VCTDSRATAGNWIASQTVKKVIPVSRLSRGEDKPTNEPTPGLLGTMAGGAAVSLRINATEICEWVSDEAIGLPILVAVFESAVYSAWYVDPWQCGG